MVPVPDPAEGHEPQRADELPAAGLVQGAVRPAVQLTPAARPRVVLDTNVAVALLVFRDPQLAALAREWNADALEAVADAATLAEFDRVLRYPELELDEAAAIAASEGYRGRCIVLAASAPDHPALPRCMDPDDQMFLRLAQASGARWLLTRDKKLLALRGRTTFRIVPPEEFDARQAFARG